MNAKKASLATCVFSAALLLACPSRALLESAGDDAPEPGPQAPVVILDPGHGGHDLGAVVGGRREKDIALAIAHKLKERLESRGAGPVRMTRDNDTFIPLDQRVDDGVEWSGRVFVSLHLNQVRQKRLQGITVYAFGKDHFRAARRRHQKRKVAPLSAPPKALAAASAKLAESIVESFRSEGLRVDAPARAGFYVLKNPTIPSVLVELGYLSNPQEAARLIDPAYQGKLADALAASLSSYLARLP